MIMHKCDIPWLWLKVLLPRSNMMSPIQLSSTQLSPQTRTEGKRYFTSQIWQFIKRAGRLLTAGLVRPTSKRNDWVSRWLNITTVTGWNCHGQPHIPASSSSSLPDSPATSLRAWACLLLVKFRNRDGESSKVYSHLWFLRLLEVYFTSSAIKDFIFEILKMNYKSNTTGYLEIWTHIL